MSGIQIEKAKQVMEQIRYMVDGQINVRYDYDVIVLGGGPGGIGAAVMAARCGAKTLLVERYAFLGGMATAGEVHPFMPNHVDNEPLDKPVYTDWVKIMHEMRSPDSIGDNGRKQFIVKELAALAAEKLCIEAGAEILYHHTFFDTVCADDNITHVILYSKSGLTAAKARVFIDCTGDADVAFKAGCECETGNDKGDCQPMTLCFKLSHIDREIMPTRDEVGELYNQARERGEIDNPRHNVLYFDWFDKDILHFNSTRVIEKSALDGKLLSEAEIEGHRQMLQLIDFLRAHVPGFKNAQLHSMGSHIGVRESRRVMGLKKLVLDDFLKARKFNDAVARCNYSIDIHNPYGGGTKFYHVPKGDWMEIPYGCIVARDCKNLCVGGRPISVDHAVHGSTRVMPPACTLGQAAGCAAAMSVAKNCSPHDLDGTEVRGKLVEMGARLEPQGTLQQH